MPGESVRPIPPDVPVSVWPTAQADSRTQRKGRYVPESIAHPGKMLPAIARHAISVYTKPGDLVIDPMCGIGTTLVEAVHLDRMAIGIEYEKQWAELALRNIEHATGQGAPGYATAIHGDSRGIDRLVGTDVTGKASLVLTSPPYGDSVHGHVRSTRDTGQRGIEKRNFRYSTDRDNLAHAGLDGLFEGLTEILSNCRTLLKPGGYLVMTVRPMRRAGQMIDIPTSALAAAKRAGFVPYERCVALLAGITHVGLKGRPSFFALSNARNETKAGRPCHVVCHEDVLVLVNGPGSHGCPSARRCGAGCVGAARKGPGAEDDGLPGRAWARSGNAKLRLDSGQAAGT
jgi:tRNA1(Val) A37 N6-methylase TrmN6